MKQNTEVSGRWEIIKLELFKILRAAGYAAIGAVLAFLLQYLSALNVGEYQVFVAAGISFLTYVMNKYFSRTEYFVKN